MSVETRLLFDLGPVLILFISYMGLYINIYIYLVIFSAEKITGSWCYA